MAILKYEITSLPAIVRNAKELPTLRNTDPNEVNKAIGQLILEVFNFYNETPNNIQLPLIVQTFKEQSKALTLPDIQLFKNNCLQGRYALKFRLTPNIFIDWLKEYQQERMEAFETYNLTAKKVRESEPISEATVKMLSSLGEKLKKPLEAESTPETTYQKEMRLRFNLKLQEFNELWKSQGEREINGQLIVEYKGKSITRSQYLEL